jgi:hypothetical protein
MSMAIRRFNWQLWAGFLLSVIAFLSYFLFFTRFPITRDFPWVNLLLFAVAAALLFRGVRSAFAPDRRLRSKVAASAVTTFGVAILGLFVFTVFIMARWLPAAHGAPQIGQKAPDFSLTDTNGKAVSLAELLSQPINGKTPKGALLVFYRGYW